MDAAQFLPTEPSPEVTQIHEGDYKDADGLWHCGVCGKARQKKINSPYFHKTVWCICDCRVKELEEQRRKEEYEEEMHRVQRLKDASMMASKFRDAEFSVYQKRTENQRAYDVSRKYAAQFRQMVTEGNPKTGEKNLGLVFYGPCGTGKSFTAACIANELMEQNISVVMTSFVKILQDIQGQDEAAYIGMLNAWSISQIKFLEGHFMTAKEYLEQVRHKQAEIGNLKRDKEAVKDMLYSLGGGGEGERVQSSRNNDKFGTLFSRIDEMERKIDDKIIDLMQFRMKVSEQINALDNVSYITILNCRYIHFQSWEKIARSAFDEERNVRSIQKLNGLALQEFEKKYAVMLAELTLEAI